MVEIVWTAEALVWLHEIHDHIAASSRAAANRVIRGILSRAEQLKSFPDSGAILDSPHKDLRMILYGHYRIVYRTITEKRVEIIGVYHGALDIASRLSSPSGNDTVHE